MKIELNDLPPIPGNLPGFTGYDRVRIEPDNTPMVVIEGVDAHHVYALEPTIPGVSAYSEAFGTITKAMARAPLAKAFLKANQWLIGHTGMTFRILDAYRPPEVQRRLFCTLFREKASPERYHPGMPLGYVLQLGLETSVVAPPAAITVNTRFKEEVDTLLGKTEMFEAACEHNGLTNEEGAIALVTIIANLNPQPFLPLLIGGAGGHGSGASIDAMPWNLDGQPVPIGAWFDDTSITAVLNFFEGETNWRLYQALAEQDPLVARYLREHDIDRVTPELCREFRNRRRAIYYAVTRYGMSMYREESWHIDGVNVNGVPTGGPIHILQQTRLSNPDVNPASLTCTWDRASAFEQAQRLMEG